MFVALDQDHDILGKWNEISSTTSLWKRKTSQFLAGCLVSEMECCMFFPTMNLVYESHKKQKQTQPTYKNIHNNSPILQGLMMCINIYIWYKFIPIVVFWPACFSGWSSWNSSHLNRRVAIVYFYRRGLHLTIQHRHLLLHRQPQDLLSLGIHHLRKKWNNRAAVTCKFSQKLDLNSWCLFWKLISNGFNATSNWTMT